MSETAAKAYGRLVLGLAYPQVVSERIKPTMISLIQAYQDSKGGNLDSFFFDCALIAHASEDPEAFWLMLNANAPFFPYVSRVKDDLLNKGGIFTHQEVISYFAKYKAENKFKSLGGRKRGSKRVELPNNASISDLLNSQE